MSAQQVISFNPKTFVGTVPVGYSIVVHQKGKAPATGYVLYGFDEVGVLDHKFSQPTYCFYKD